MTQPSSFADATLRTTIFDANARYFGLDTRVLMENAGRGVADAVLARYGDAKQIALVCGLNRSGGAGLVAARHLLDHADVTVFLLDSPRDIAMPEARANWAILARTGVKRIVVCDSADLASHDLDAFDLVVDAMLGPGTTGEPHEPDRTAIMRINASHAVKVSVDIPAGHGSSTPVNADLTLSLHFAKCAGAVVLPVGVPADLEAGIGPGDVKVLRRRGPDTHKGQAGRTMIVGGSAFFRGALEYAGRAAAQIVDLVYHCSPRPCEGVLARVPDLLGSCLEGEVLNEGHLAEILGRIEACRGDSVLVGPGLGLGPATGVTAATKRLVVRLVAALNEGGTPTVVDADGLNALTDHLEVLGPHVVVTPHRGEFRKLAGTEPTADQVTAWAAKHRCTVVVKGPVDIVSNGRETKLNYTGNPGMATGGTGDVLSGALAGFAAGNDLFRASCAAAFVTGLAGDLVYQVKGANFTAGDVVGHLADAIKWAEEF